MLHAFINDTKREKAQSSPAAPSQERAIERDFAEGYAQHEAPDAGLSRSGGQPSWPKAQSAYGNQAVLRMMKPASQQSGVLQRKCTGGGTVAGCADVEEKESSLQRSAASPEEPGQVPGMVNEVLRSSGQPLDERTRSFMEPRFGTDFGHVRVHTGGKAAESAQAVHASAYTVGRHIVFGEGAYQPETNSGRALLAHELVHVVQQRGNSEATAAQSLDISSPSDASEVEADRLSHSIVAAPEQASPAAQSNVKARPHVQRGPLDAFLNSMRQMIQIDPRDVNLVGPVFNQVVNSNIAAATYIRIPMSWRTTLLSYALSNPLDGIVLLGALGRAPSFYRGGWIMSLQPNAIAMTLNYSIFVNGPLSLATFAHELTHVFQYGLLGVTSFLTTYFGMSALTILYRWATGQPTNVMRSSPHESQAYNLEARFMAWHQSTYGTDPHSITV